MTDEATHGIDLTALMMNSHDPLFLLNEAGSLVLVNAPAAKLLGLAIGRSGRVDLAEDATQRPQTKTITATLTPPSPVFEGKAVLGSVLLTDSRGERVWRAVQYVPLTGSDGVIAAIMGRIEATEPEPAMTGQQLAWRDRLNSLRSRLHKRFRIDDIVAASPRMQQVLAQARLASQTSANVLLLGEQGTGKQQIARTIHAQGPHHDAPFIVLDCEAIPGATFFDFCADDGFLMRPSQGRARSERPGTIYLREPLKLRLDLQHRLLDQLDKLTGDLGTRVIAGSTDEPMPGIHGAEYVEELWCRLGTIRIEIPPLRERAQDLLLLVQRILDECNEEGSRAIREWSPDVERLLCAHTWPGNVAELRSVIQSAHASSESPRLELAALPHVLRGQVELQQMAEPAAPRSLPLDELLGNAEKRLLEMAVRDAGGNLSKASERLSISRARLYRRLEHFGLHTPTEGDLPGGELRELKDQEQDEG